MIDIINGLLEFAAGLFILNHCRVLVHDKNVAGVSVISVVFFSAWGFWNLYYYPALDQWASFLGGLLVVMANCAWVALILHYRRQPKKKEPFSVGLSFARLRNASFKRSKEFNTCWDKNEAMTELLGELGEAANILKKLNRAGKGRGKPNAESERELYNRLAEEIADAQICLDNFARIAGINLEAAVVHKFNATSHKHKLNTFLE